VTAIEIPDDWWIAEGATGEPTVWAPTHANQTGCPGTVVEERAVNHRLWGLLAAVLPDRGDCEWCTATPCIVHAKSEAEATS